MSTFFQPSESNNTAAHAPRTKDLQDAAEVKETSDALLSRLRAKELERHLDRNIINVVEKQVEEGEKQEDRRQEQETSVVLEEKLEKISAPKVLRMKIMLPIVLL